MPRTILKVILTIVGVLVVLPAAADPASWRAEWPDTDFSKHSVAFEEIIGGGPPRDGIPSIDRPRFNALRKVAGYEGTEPVIGLEINGDRRAYPLGILTWHEIVNDVVGGVPVAVTYCPLCNAAIVFDRRVGGTVLEFGTTGKLRHSDLIMYDRQTESWWQQFSGEAIVGESLGQVLETIPARLESFADFKGRFPEGKILVPNNPDLRDYGANPYVGYDSSGFPFLFKGQVPEFVFPLARVVVVDGRAWKLDYLREKGRVDYQDLVLSWKPGQNSALDTRAISAGRDVGSVTVQRRTDGQLADVSYDVTFAFVFFAFHPHGEYIR
jgi:hypothetical protein